jgi:hypothetical protein
MCRFHLIGFLIGLFFIRDSTASGSVCKNDRGRLIQNQETYDIENCANTEINLGNETARASLIYVRAFVNQISKISDDTFKSAKKIFHINLSKNHITRQFF